MRADRLVATLLVLQARGRVTAGQLAEELEVSERTARRDLEGLAMAGSPGVLPARPWRRLGADRRGPDRPQRPDGRRGPGPLPHRRAPPPPHPDVRAALRKLVQALPATFREHAEAAAAAVVRDPAGWDDPSRPRWTTSRSIQHAVIEGVQLELGYRGRDGKLSLRTVHPLGLVVKNDTWYLIAGTEAGQRTFRVSRVRSAERTDNPVDRPEDFDLAEAWSSIVTTVDRQRAPVEVTAADRRSNGRTCCATSSATASSHGDPDGDGQVEVTLRAQSEWLVARQLAGFSDGIEVVAPDAVRLHLAEIGRGLVRRHAG